MPITLIKTAAGFFAALISISSTARAETIRGELFTRGNPENRQTIISGEPDNRKITVCPGPLVSQLIQLAGTVATISGPIGRPSKAKEPCIEVERFEVHEIVKGRPAFIGELKMTDKNKYAIIGANGKSWTLSKIPPGLKGLLNTRVICDLVADEAHGETTWLVARAFSMPSQ